MVKVRQTLVPSSNYKYKCPNKMTPEYITVHNTANDASAENEIRYMIHNTNQTSYHYAVDDKEAIQGVALDRNAWHCGDGNGAGNSKSIGIEICYSKSGGERYYKAEKNAVKLIAQLLRERGWGINRVKKHQDWSGKYCPHRILEEGRWNQFLQEIQKELKGVDEMLEKAIVINSFADFPMAESLALRLQAPVYLRETADGKKVAKELYIVGGAQGKLVADKVTLLSGANRFETAAAVAKFLK
jgi:N-acetylmuramoyl-L-alanine amidase CwlA